jgi:hypothetical protein
MNNNNNKRNNHLSSSNSAFFFRLSNNSTDKLQQRDYKLFIEVGICQIEIDPTIVDRFDKFFMSRPFFFEYKHQLLRQSITLNQTTSVINCGFLSDFLEDGTKQPISLSITCDCKKLIFIIRYIIL